jgi:hypothetical protein
MINHLYVEPTTLLLSGKKNLLFSTTFEKIQWPQGWSFQVMATSENIAFSNLDEGMDEAL